MTSADREKYDGEERRAEQPWHLDRGISIAHILSTLVIGMSLLGWATSLDKAVAVNSSNIAHAEAERVRMRTDITRALERQSDALVRIETKLDEKIDRKEIHNGQP